MAVITVKIPRRAKASLRAGISVAQGFLRMLPALPRIVRTAIHRVAKRSDYTRWRDPANLEAWWESRTKLIATLIPGGARVIEFGAGQRRLSSHLDSSCFYIPSDLVDRGPGTFICDLNHRPLPDLSPMRPDVAVFAGVLEYVSDVHSVVGWLSREVAYCAASYECANASAGTLARFSEDLRRTKFGYMSRYTEGEFIELFARFGFACARTETWNGQRLFLFHNLSGRPR